MPNNEKKNPKSAVTFRIPKLQAILLSCSPYKDNKAILIRVLLDAYFANELPQVKRRFEEEVSKKALNTSQGINTVTSNKIAARETVITWAQKQSKAQAAAKQFLQDQKKPNVSLP